MIKRKPVTVAHNVIDFVMQEKLAYLFQLQNNSRAISKRLVSETFKLDRVLFHKLISSFKWIFVSSIWYIVRNLA